MKGDAHMLEAALLRTMTLLASLNVASEIAFGMRERKAGRDPSIEEHKDIVLPELQAELNTLKALIFQIQSSLAIAQEVHERPAPTVDRFIDLVRLQKAGHILHRIHQRLLSLYPAIDEFLVEEARLLKNTCDSLKGADATSFFDLLTSFVNQAQRFVYRVSEFVRRQR